MYVEELIFDNITDNYDKYGFESKYEYFKLVCKVLNQFGKVEFNKSNLEYISGSKDMWGELNRKIYNSTLNYNMDYGLPCGDLAHIINDTIKNIKEQTNKKRNKIAIEYLMGYREDNRISLLKNTDNELLKKFVYGFMEDEQMREEHLRNELEEIRKIKKTK